ncbi:carboxylesterase/lipase family protein [Nonomuraea sp. NPDC050556]|uniref:carboxylesterase/lipase family protein n=1 Tax=Nonomuraea sp. NPDC050556 TaxID=3364369 RepID=UPI0037B15B6A
MIATTTGRVSGLDNDTVFKGIPYAKTPFGPLRLAAPAPVEPWDGVFEATAFGPRPPQPAMPGGAPAWDPAGGLDCLTLNVWTPDKDGAGLPVMVWIYGGAYITGSTDVPEYDGTLLAAEGVVVVTVNYRVGFEGFGHVEGAPPNRGLLDQVAALRWVRDNVGAFGGDPGNVTVFGESAGAGSIAALLAMPSAAGLFRRAILQSVPGTFFSPAYAARVSAAILGGASPYELEPLELVERVEEFRAAMDGAHAEWGPLAFTPTPFSPVVDGVVLPDTPWNALADGASSDVDVIVGFNRDEFRLFTMMSGKPGDLALALKELAPPGADVVYRTAHPQADNDQLYELLLGDWLFRMPSATLADLHTGPTFAYELTWDAPALGACHGLDVPLTFGTLDGMMGQLLTHGAPEGPEISVQIRRAWTRFAATGNPGWPVYEPVAAITHLFDVEPKDVSDPEAASRALWSAPGFPVL